MIHRFLGVSYKLISAFLILSVAALLVYVMHKNTPKLPLRQYFSESATSAVWDWKNPMTYEKADAEQAADFLVLRQIDVIYVDVGVYLDQKTNKSQLGTLTKSIENYIGAMNSRGIRVYASSGHTDWSMPSFADKPESIQQYVYTYNTSHDSKFAGIMFDIESYNQTGFPEASFTEKELVLLEYLDLVDSLVTAHSSYITTTGHQMDLGFAIPYWFDNSNQNIKSISWHDKTGPVLYHLMDRLNELPSATVVVMAYRKAALGSDGMIFHSRTEVDYAQSKAPNVKIVIGVEVNNVEPEKISFYNKSYNELSNELNFVSTEFKDKKSMAGFAINDLEGLRVLP